MNLLYESIDSKSEQAHYKDKFYKVLEEKSILEDEILSIANLARTYQFQAKSYKEELESLKSSFQLICSQNSELESEIITITTKIYSLEDELQQSKSIKDRFLSEIARLKDIVDKDSQTTAIKELSYIILSRDRPSPEKPLAINKYSEVIKEALEDKLKSIEKEREEYHYKCREYLSAYITVLQETIEVDRNLLQAISINHLTRAQEIIRKRIQDNDFSLLQADLASDNIEGEELSFYTSITGSPKISEDIFSKVNKNLVSVNYLTIQASALEDLLQRSSIQ